MGILLRIFPLIDPFSEFRAGFANFILAVFGIVCMVTLGATIIYIIQGEKDSAKKMLRWVILIAIGFVFIEIIKNL